MPLAVWAMGVILTIAGGLYLLNPDTIPSEPGLVYATENGQQSTVRLADGSHVRLNAASKLTVSAGYAEFNREVYLEGEAFFDVAGDTALPFIVNGRRGVVEVVGTEFVVSSYEDEMAHVAVAEGSVFVSDRRGTSDILGPSDVVVFQAEQWRVSRDVTDLDQYMAWTEKRLVFKATPFDTVIRQLGRWYNVDIKSDVAPSLVDDLTASFSDEPLDEVLYVVSRALNVRYDRDGNRVRFYVPGAGDA